VEQGYAQGLEEGRQAAAVELQQQVVRTLQPLLELCRNFDEALKSMDVQIASQLVRIALEAARQLAGEALTAQPEQVLVLVNRLLDSDLELTGKPKLWLNPEDLRRVQDSLGEQLDAAGWACTPTRRCCRAAAVWSAPAASWMPRGLRGWACSSATSNGPWMSGHERISRAGANACRRCRASRCRLRRTCAAGASPAPPAWCWRQSACVCRWAVPAALNSLPSKTCTPRLKWLALPATPCT
jgi:hypothetical protein